MKKGIKLLVCAILCTTTMACDKFSTDKSSTEKPSVEQSPVDKSPIEKLFSSEESLREGIEGKFLKSESSEDNTVIYFKKNKKFEIDAYVDGTFKEVARGEYNITTDENTPCIELSCQGGLRGMVTSEGMTISNEEKSRSVKDLKIITREEAEKYFQ